MLLTCDRAGCSAERVSGSQYCDDHLLEQQVRVSEAREREQVQPSGTLADLFRKAKAAGHIAPVSSGYAHTA